MASFLAALTALPRVRPAARTAVLSPLGSKAIHAACNVTAREIPISRLIPKKQKISSALWRSTGPSSTLIRGSVPFEQQKRLRFQVTAGPQTDPRWGFIWTHGLTSSAQNESEGGWPFGGVAGLADVMPLARYDARGHGTSDTASGCTWHSMGEDLLRIKEVMGNRKIILGGTSMGAAASLIAAMDDPSNVAGLILATPPTCYEKRKRFIPLYHESAEIARRHGLKAAKEIATKRGRPQVFLRSQMGRASFDIDWRAKFEMGVERYCMALEGAAESDLPPQKKLPTLNIPTMILAWKTDALHPVSTAQMLRKELPDAELHVAGSWAEIEEFPSLMRGFLQRVMEQG